MFLAVVFLGVGVSGQSEPTCSDLFGIVPAECVGRPDSTITSVCADFDAAIADCDSQLSACQAFVPQCTVPSVRHPGCLTYGAESGFGVNALEDVTPDVACVVAIPLTVNDANYNYYRQTGGSCSPIINNLTIYNTATWLSSNINIDPCADNLYFEPCATTHSKANLQFRCTDSIPALYRIANRGPLSVDGTLSTDDGCTGGVRVTRVEFFNHAPVIANAVTLRAESVVLFEPQAPVYVGQTLSIQGDSVNEVVVNVTVYASEITFRTNGFSGIDFHVAPQPMTPAARPLISSTGGSGYHLLSLPVTTSANIDMNCKRFRLAARDLHADTIDSDTDDTELVFLDGNIGNITIDGAIMKFHALNSNNLRIERLSMTSTASTKFEIWNEMANVEIGTLEATVTGTPATSFWTQSGDTLITGDLTLNVADKINPFLVSTGANLTVVGDTFIHGAISTFAAIFTGFASFDDFEAQGAATVQHTGTLAFKKIIFTESVQYAPEGGTILPPSPGVIPLMTARCGLFNLTAPRVAFDVLDVGGTADPCLDVNGLTVVAPNGTALPIAIAQGYRCFGTGNLSCSVL